MSKVVPILSKVMLIVGGVLILAGLGWGIWGQLNAPPDPTISDAGAVVLAVTAPVERSPTLILPTVTLTPTPAPTDTPSSAGPTPELLPDWTPTPEPTATQPEPTPLPPTSTPTLTPSPTPPPRAEKPPTHISATDVELDAKVVPMGWEAIDRNGTMVSEWKVPKGAAGWHVNSALPGNGGNVVLSGHHNIEGKVFRYVLDLEPGNELTLDVDDTLYTYIVTEKYILKEAGMPLEVRQKNAQWIMPTDDERLTLVTCWPYEWPGNTHRVIVVARPPGYFELDIANSQ